MARCEDVDQNRECILPEGVHAHHTDGQGHWWANQPVLAEIARRPKPVQRRRDGKPKSGPSHPARMKMLRARAHMTGQVDDPEVWTVQVLEILEGFLATHDGDFTTPEDIWPLIPDSAVDGRAMRQVVRKALASGMIVDTGRTRRLGGGLHTADGTEFGMNKIVPVYRRGSGR